MNPCYIDLFRKYWGVNSKDLLNGISLIDDKTYNTDGILKCWYVNEEGTHVDYFLLIECKLHANFLDTVRLAEVLIQALHYAKSMRDSDKKGYIAPKSIVLGSKESCAVISLSGRLYDYLDRDFKSRAASQAYKVDIDILNDLITDINKSLFIYKVFVYNFGCTKDEQYDIERSIVDTVVNYAKNNVVGDKVNLKNFSKVFKWFIDITYKNEGVSCKDKLEVLRQVLESYDGHVYHSDYDNSTLCRASIKKKSKAIELHISDKDWKLFNNLYNIREGMSYEDLSYLASNRDKYIEDEERRRGGDFYTPKIWVTEGHNYLTKVLGDNWRNEYIIWDLCCGTGNLTRGLQNCVKYLSTLSEADLDVAIRGNQGAILFNYDFLNDDVSVNEYSIGCWNSKKFDKLNILSVDKELENFSGTKLYEVDGGKVLLRLLLSGYWSSDEGVKLKRGNYGVGKTFEKKKLLILINPPYAAATNLKDVENAKVGVNDSKIKNDILHVKSAKSLSENLYSQFMYRILCLIKQFKNCEISVASYIKSTIWTGPKFESLRHLYGEEGYGLVGGFKFKGSEFAGCSNKWSLDFTLLKPNADTMDEVKLDVKTREVDSEGKAVINVLYTDEVYYSVKEDDRLSTWVRPKSDNSRITWDGPQLSNGLTLSSGNGKNLGGLLDDTLGYIMFMNNCVDKYKFVFSLSSCAKSGHGFNILSSNYDNAIVGFVARKLIKPVWYNQKKEFMKPNTENEKYIDFVHDSYIASMFIDGATWSSLRSFEYVPDVKKKVRNKVGCVTYLGNNLWDIHNEFFWMNKEEIYKLSNKYKVIPVCIDCENDEREQSYTYKNKILVNKDKFTTEALNVLRLAEDLVSLSFKYRKEAIETHPEWNLQAWDAGWYQVKKLITWEKCLGDDELQVVYENFKKAFNILQDKMRPIVYELGMLR